jgi:hypothetical protein
MEEEKRRREEIKMVKHFSYCFVLRDRSVGFSPCSFSNNILWSSWTPTGEIGFLFIFMDVFKLERGSAIPLIVVIVNQQSLGLQVSDTLTKIV